MFSGAQVSNNRARHDRGTERDQDSHRSPRPALSTRGGSGLGDAIYLQSVARHLIGQGYQVEACSDWPDVFSPLAPHVTVSPFRRDRIDRNAHYSMRRHIAGTTQFEDCCIQAGIKEPVELALDWTIENQALIDELKAPGKPVIIVPMPRAPFARKDGFGIEFLPDCRAIDRAIAMLDGRATIVQIGAGKALYQLAGIDIDLANKTTVREVLDIGCVADGFLGFCSFIVPLAESFKRPALFIWSRRGLSSPHLPVRLMTPKKILHRESSRAVLDNCKEADLGQAVDAFLEQIGGARAL